MKSVLVLLVLFAGTILGYPDTPQWMKDKELVVDGYSSLVPQEDGTFRLMTHEEARREYENTPRPHEDLVVFFEHYDRLSWTETQPIQLNNKTSLQRSKFNPARPTKFLVHGWRGHAYAQMNQHLLPSLLNAGDYNIFVIDWSSKAQTYNYVSARYSVEDVATVLAAFIDFVYLEGKLKFEDLTLIGHSLGAHVSGMAAKKVKYGQIQNIIGLDPALPLFSYKNLDERLDPDDAEYVQTIQTNGGYLGFHMPIGKATFYPNWGTTQPGCGFDAMGICAHRRSYEYYAESLASNNSFIPFDCKEYRLVQMKKFFEPELNARMGGDPANYGHVKGIFFVPTNPEYPFGRALADG